MLRVPARSIDRSARVSARLGPIRETYRRCLRRRLLPQHSQACGGSTTTRSRGRCSGNVWRSPRLRVNPRIVVVLATARSAASSSSVAAASSSSNVSVNRPPRRRPRPAPRPPSLRLDKNYFRLANGVEGVERASCRHACHHIGHFCYAARSALGCLVVVI